MLFIWNFLKNVVSLPCKQYKLQIMDTKICKICGEEKLVECFKPVHSKDKDGNRYRCRVCRKCHSARDRQYVKNYKKLNPEWLKQQRAKDWKKYYKNPDKMNRCKTRIRKNRSENYEYCMINGARSRAKLDNLEFNLKREDIMIPQFCPLLDIELCTTNTKICDNSPSLDRIDNSKGYTPDNIRVISNLANKMKSSATYEQMTLFAERILKYMKPTLESKKIEESLNLEPCSQEALLPATVQPEFP